MAAPDEGWCPNYAAVVTRHGFPAKHFFTGDPERGLKQCIDRGPWRAGRVESYLAGRPRDFAGCFETLGGAAAQRILDDWQLHLWNRIVAAWLSRRLGPEGRALQLNNVRLVTWPALPDGLGLERLEVPLPHSQAGYEGEWRELAAEVIGAEGTTVEGLVSHDLPSLKLPEGMRRVAVAGRDADPEVWAAHERARSGRGAGRKGEGPVGPRRDRG